MRTLQIEIDAEAKYCGNCHAFGNFSCTCQLFMQKLECDLKPSLGGHTESYWLRCQDCLDHEVGRTEDDEQES